MRTIWIALVLLLPLLTAATCEELTAPDSPTAADAVALPDAVEQGLVEAQFEGTGGASGDVVHLRIKRAVPKALSVSVATGLVINNSTPGEQDMIVRRLRGETAGEGRYHPATTIVLADDEWHEYVLDAYCLEAHKGNPSVGSAFSMGPAPKADVLAVLQAVDDVPNADGNIHAIQAAVWAITDDLGRAELRQIGYELSSDDLDAARAIVEAAGLDPARYRLFGGP